MTVYIVGNRWLEEYAAWRSDINRGKPKYLAENLSQCHFVHHKTRTDRPGTEHQSTLWEDHQILVSV
jgi:hypothetical protein